MAGSRIVDTKIIRLLALLAFASIESGSAIAGCQSNITKKGNFFIGTSFSTWDFISNVPQELAYTRIYTKLAQEGWKIEQADAKVGIISASTQISFSGGHSAPLNVIVQPKDGGSKITATLTVGGGQIATEPAADLCKMIGAAEVE